MTKFKNYLSVLLVVALAIFTFSCDNNDEIVVDPNANFDAILEVDEAGVVTKNVDVNVNSTQSDILAKVSFTSTTSMKRLYITQNIQGQGEEKFEPLENIDLKGDGSVDLTGKNDKDFEYQFELPVPAGFTNGTVVYKFWVTSGNGDFRDIAQRLIGRPGTITLRYGTASNPAAEVKVFSNVKLFAPLADGSSKTFVSTSDGQTYNVSQGIEFVSLWDFGYLYSTNDGATLRAPYNYNVPYYPGTLAQPIIDIATKANTTNDELNKTYFKESTTFSVSQFDAINASGDLNTVSATTSNALYVQSLAVDDIIEFVDQYGKKGLIKVLEINPGNQSDKYIRIAIKVQP